MTKKAAPAGSGAASLVKIALQCGHQITTRTSPYHAKSKYICPANEQCGYNVAWKSYTLTNGTTWPNRTLEKKDEGT